MSVKVNYCSVEERDMDTLFLEAIASDNGFLKIFLNKVAELKDCDDFVVQNIHLSKADNDGESDITVIIKSSEKKIGLLIEDKINAPAMDEQCNRYSVRGDKGKQNGDYDDFFVYLVAPKKYYDTNAEAKKYAHYVSYEDCKAYFETKNDILSKIWVQQFAQALDKAKKHSSATYNETRNKFLREYINYQKKHYPNILDIANTPETAVAGGWVNYRTKYKNSVIWHKAEKGFMDLTFFGTADKENTFKVLAQNIRAIGYESITAVKTGKSMVLRIKVPEIQFDMAFDDCNKEELNICFEAAEKLTRVAELFKNIQEIC